MTATISIAPVKKRIRVEVPQARAFDVFTNRIGAWWPRRASIGSAKLKTVTIEPREGGAWFEEGEDGSRATVGRVTIWDPPARLVVSWDVNHRWKPDTTVSSEVEVVFTPDGPGATIVELEHRNFEALGQAGGESMRRDVDGGWPGILEAFRVAAEE